MTYGYWSHEDGVKSAQFSSDGMRVVTASTDETAQQWDARTGKTLGETLRHQDSVRSAQFSRDCRRAGFPPRGQNGAAMGCLACCFR